MFGLHLPLIFTVCQLSTAQHGYSNFIRPSLHLSCAGTVFAHQFSTHQQRCQIPVG